MLHFRFPDFRHLPYLNYSVNCTASPFITIFNMEQEEQQINPVIYACSGSTCAGQLTNSIAVKLDREGLGTMSCIAGVGGQVESLLETARSGRPVIAIDGCSLGCSRKCLLDHQIMPALHIDLSDYGVIKDNEPAIDPARAAKIFDDVRERVRERKIFPQLKQGPEITIVEVKYKVQMEAFIDLPYRLYKGNPFYVPQLKKDVAVNFDRKKNPAFDFCEARYWLAIRDGKVVGRIAGIINHAYIERWGRKMLRFGWMDFENDPDIAKALLRTVEHWAAERGMEAVHGPLGFTNFDYAGFLTKGFDQMGTFATIYNHPYYMECLEAAGYEKEVEWVEYRIKLGETPSARLAKLANVVRQRNELQVVKAKSTKELLAYGQDIFKLVNEAYEGLFGFVPLNDRQIAHNIRKYLSFIRPEFVSLVLDKEQRLAAFGITMPSLSAALQKAKGKLYPFGIFHMLRAFGRNAYADLLLVAVRKDLQGKGLNAILMHELEEAYINKGIRFAESNPELEENTKVQALWQYFDAEQHKRRCCYIRRADNP